MNNQDSHDKKEINLHDLPDKSLVKSLEIAKIKELNLCILHNQDQVNL